MNWKINNLQETLDLAKPLEGMEIKICEIARDGDRAIYVAEILAPDGKRHLIFSE